MKCNEHVKHLGKIINSYTTSVSRNWKEEKCWKTKTFKKGFQEIEYGDFRSFCADCTKNYNEIYDHKCQKFQGHLSDYPLLKTNPIQWVSVTSGTNRGSWQQAATLRVFTLPHRVQIYMWYWSLMKMWVVQLVRFCSRHVSTTSAEADI
jgi:hypothetical protein